MWRLHVVWYTKPTSPEGSNWSRTWKMQNSPSTQHEHLEQHRCHHHYQGKVVR